MLIYSEVLKYRTMYHEAAHAFVKMSGEVCDCSVKAVGELFTIVHFIPYCAGMVTILLISCQF